MVTIMMRKFDSPYMADWIAISLRWVMLVGFTVSLGLGGGNLALFTSLPLALLIIWNLTMSAMAGMNMRVTYHRVISVVADLILVGDFYWVQGGVHGPAFWAGLLPVLTGAIYFEIWGALALSILFSALVMYTGLQPPENLGLAIIVSVSQTVLSLLFGFLSRSMIKGNRDQLNTVVEKRAMTQATVQTDRIRAIYDLTQELTSTLSYARVLESALNVSASAMNPDPEQSLNDPLVGAVLLFKDDMLQVGSARRFTTADLRASFPAEAGILKKAIDEGDPIHFNDIGADPELGRVAAFQPCKSGYCFPLRSGLSVYGTLVFAHPTPDYFTRERRSLLDIIGRQSVIAIQNARLYQDLVEEKERMTEVQEEARKKLARDLHDGPTQSVAAMAMRLNIIRRMVTKDTGAAIEEITKLEELAHRTTKEIRHMLFTLRPLVLESQGLTAALKSMSDKMRETYNQNVTVAIDEKIAAQMEMGKQGVIFYIIEEAVNNARKHASAQEIAVRLRQIDNGIALLEIIDNGVGFDIKAMSEQYLKRANSSLGMVNLRERAEMVGGILQMDSAPGKGTKVQVYIPLTEEAADRMRNARNK
jgi:signal transduction histidine kinase